MPNTGLLSLLEGSAGAATEVISTLVDGRGPRRVLTYESEVVPILRTQQGFQESMQVRYRGAPIAGVVNLCRVVMINSGSEALSDQPVLIQLKEGVTVLEERFTTIPEQEFGEITIDQERSVKWRRRYKVELMNPGNRIRVDLTVAGEFSLSDITVVARGKGLKCLPKASYTLRQGRRKGMLFSIMALLTVGALTVLISPQIEWLKTLYEGLLAVAISLGLTRALAGWRRSNKKLSYEIVSLSPLYTVDSLYSGQVSVEYMERPVANLHTCQVALWNTGNRTLENQGVLLEFAEARVLNTEVHPEPELEFGPITWDALGGDSVKYHFSQFDPGDKVNIDLIFEGDIDRKDVKVYAKGEMLRVEPKWRGTKYTSIAAIVGVAVWLLAVLAAVVLMRISLRLDILRSARSAIYGWFVDLSAEPGFWPGIYVGMVGFGTFAFTVVLIRDWWRTATAPLKEREAWSRAGEAAAQDLSRSVRSMISGLLVFTCIVATLVAVVAPDTSSRLLRSLGF